MIFGLITIVMIKVDRGIVMWQFLRQLLGFKSQTFFP
jgi:hypothetical protein